MTLLVLDLRLPAKEMIHSEHDLWRAAVVIAPQILMYMMSFLTLGIFWVGQQTLLNYLARCDRNMAWLNLAFLFTITILPFSTKFLAEFIAYRSALIVYWMNIVVQGAVLYGIWGYALRAKLVKEDMPPDAPDAICHRIVIGQGLYAFGALLCIFGTYWSVAFIVLVQLNFAIAPSFRRSASSDSSANLGPD
jgi:uncharacterized membrane protein